MKTISLTKAVILIQQGEVAAVPTETVYGLAGSAENLSAVKKIFQIKKRPLFNPLIIHCCDLIMMKKFHIEKHPVLNKMIKYFCPGPVTFILNKSRKVHPIITAGHKKVGLRIPQHEVLLKLIKKTNTALCAPSANLYGKLSPTCAEHIYKIFQGQVPILDGGACAIGIESTVLEPDFKNQCLFILRPGPVSKRKLINWLKIENLTAWKVKEKTSFLSPGQAKNHYQPATPLGIIEVTGKKELSKKHIQQALFKVFPPNKSKIFKELKLLSSAVLSARKLYRQMNVLSQNPAHVLYVLKTKKNSTAHWQAVWDRLYKASSFKLTI